LVIYLQFVCEVTHTHTVGFGSHTHVRWFGFTTPGFPHTLFGLRLFTVHVRVLPLRPAHAHRTHPTHTPHGLNAHHRTRPATGFGFTPHGFAAAVYVATAFCAFTARLLTCGLRFCTRLLLHRLRTQFGPSCSWLFEGPTFVDLFHTTTPHTLHFTYTHAALCRTGFAGFTLPRTHYARAAFTQRLVAHTARTRTLVCHAPAAHALRWFARCAVYRALHSSHLHIWLFGTLLVYSCSHTFIYTLVCLKVTTFTVMQLNLQRADLVVVGCSSSPFGLRTAPVVGRFGLGYVSHHTTVCTVGSLVCWFTVPTLVTHTLLLVHWLLPPGWFGWFARFYFTVTCCRDIYVYARFTTRFGSHTVCGSRFTALGYAHLLAFALYTGLVAAPRFFTHV